jgi:hypothetical protein
MQHKRAQELRWTVVDRIFDLYHYGDEILGEELTEDESRYLYNLAVRVARNFNVHNHIDLHKVI